MGSFLWNLLFFAIAIGLLVTIHEAGHFFAAKLCKVKILRFSIGFGKVLWSKTGKDGCEYAVSAIPLGGYVKMFGESVSEAQNIEGNLKQQSFYAKPLFQRAFIIAAGPLCNIVLAFILYTLINISGVTLLKPIIGDVTPNSEAAVAGFKTYDLIEKIDGLAVDDWKNTLLTLLAHTGEKNVAVAVKRDLGKGESSVLHLDLSNLEITPKSDPLSLIGLKVCVGKIENVIDAVSENSPAARAGLRQGDEIISINGIASESWYRTQDMIAAANGQALDLVIKRNGTLYSTKIVPDLIYDKERDIYRPMVGIVAKAEVLPELSQKVQYNLVDATLKAFADTYEMSLVIVKSAVKLATGAISAENIAGPIAIAKGAGESATIGLTFFLSFLAAISVNLGILNLIPIPVLDGGQLLFIAYEAVFKKAPNEKVQFVLTALGMSLLLSLSALAIFNDLRAL